MFPCDEVISIGSVLSIFLVVDEAEELMRGNLQPEKDRMDIFHKFFQVARRDALHSTPFTPNYDLGPRILDLGCGTGIWAIDMAE